MSDTSSDIAVTIDFDPATWLAGPDDPRNAAEWTQGALAACAEDFGVEAGSSEHEYLKTVLSEFATRDLGTGNRFLRLRTVNDDPLVARLDIYVGMPEHEVADAFETYDESITYYDPPRVEVVDPSRQLRRSLRFMLDDGIRSIVRYHRRIDDLGVDILVSCTGTALRPTAGGLPDLDGLARAVWVVSPEGERR